MSGPRVNTPSAAVYRRRRLVALGAMAVVVFLIAAGVLGFALAKAKLSKTVPDVGASAHIDL